MMESFQINRELHIRELGIIGHGKVLMIIRQILLVFLIFLQYKTPMNGHIILNLHVCFLEEGVMGNGGKQTEPHYGFYT